MSSQKPSLLYVMHCFFNRAGTEEHTRTLIAGLKDLFDITVIAPKDSVIQVIRDGAAVQSLPAPQVTWPGTPYRSAPHEEILAKLLEEIAPQVIHLQHFYNWPLCIFDQLIATGKPVVHTVHDYYLMTPYFTMQGARDAKHALSAEFNTSIFKADLSPYLTKRYEILKSSLAKVRTILAPSSYTAREVESVFPVNVKVIEHGIIPFDPLPKVGSPKLRFGYVGSTLPQKGWYLLQESFSEVHKQYPDTELHFYGGKPDPGYIVPSGVTFHGVYNLPDLPRICANVDVVFIPSLFAESYGLVMSELWHGDVPVAASDIGAFSARITDGVNGKLFRPGDVAHIAETMRWFIEHDEWQRWKLPEPRKVHEMVADYQALYTSLL